jgi:hypothetical protein
MPKNGPWRQRKGVQHDTWHWCRNCSNDPKSDYDTSYTKPTSGELCDECKSKEARGDCS